MRIPFIERFDFGTLMACAGFAGLILAGLLLHWVSVRVLARIYRDRQDGPAGLILSRLAGPSRILLPFLLAKAGFPATGIVDPLAGLVLHAIDIGIISSLSFLTARLIHVARDLLYSRYDLGAADNLSARKLHTQVGILEKVLLAVVGVVAISSILMTFEGIRQVGVSLLASAGIAGILLGLAAQKTLGTLLAGLQVAVTQPIRMDDVLIVEGEWGRVEEITLTYVVVRIWDLRRLVVPIQYFIEKPFQNWTRTSSEILGTVFLHLDYGTPIEDLRRELDVILRSTPLWDGKVSGLQVTECRGDRIEVRLLISAATASAAWDLRCLVRERMVAFIQEKYPQFLPRLRAELSTTPPGRLRRYGSAEGPVRTHESSART